MIRFQKLATTALALTLSSLSYGQMERDPETNLVIPSKGQLAWHEDEVGVFYHMNPTFPLENMSFSNFDPVKIIDAAESVGAKHIVIVCKHVNGFCWWPTKATKPGDSANTKNIALTPFKNGKGDVVKEIFEEARKRGIRPGVYLATRDDHFGAGEKGAYKDQKVYNDYYMTQATELATQYGPLAEWWVDGSSNPALGKRLHALLQKHQPDAVVFQSTYATIRWVGNEHGHSPYPIWNPIEQEVWDRIHLKAGRSVTTGNPDGVRWVPAEVDTTFTSGWFGGAPRSLDDLKDVFYHSVGNGVGLLINFPVQKDGTIHPDVLQRAAEFKDYMDNAIGHKLYQINDQQGKEVTLTFEKPAEVDHIIIKEDLRFGERIRKFKLEAFDGSQWFPVRENGVSLGYQLINKLEPTVIEKVRLTILESVGTPRIKEISVTRFGLKKPDLTAPTAPTHFTATSQGRKVTLNWSPAQDPETGIKQYLITRNGKPLATTTQTNHTDTTATELTNYTYSITALNNSGLTHGDPVSTKIKTSEDTTPPTVKEVNTLPGRTALEVVFDEAVDPATAATIKNYAISGFDVTAATLSPKSPHIVNLSLDSRIPWGAKIELFLRNITDTAKAKNAIPDGTTHPVYINSYGLTRHWTMDKVVANKLVDSVKGTQTHEGTIHGATQTKGKLGNALFFDGKSYVDCKNAGVQTNFSIAFWIKPNKLNGQQVIFAKEENGKAAYQFRMVSEKGRPYFHMSNENAKDFGLWKFQAERSLKPNTWNHVAIVNQDNTYTLYIDGQVAATKELDDFIQQPYNFTHFILGANWSRGMKDPRSHFSGALDDFRIYTEVLPHEEIKLLADGQ
ncbi:LamG-like jellyroll fold domain-containing protein [Rubritalea tangerina]|uniref:alpha-L-fucosidase n=1 Tax=Rubritalea tangerina TaxID=430798 RepID=A0ABW4Z7F0_9BACT